MGGLKGELALEIARFPKLFKRLTVGFAWAGGLLGPSRAPLPRRICDENGKEGVGGAGALGLVFAPAERWQV